MEEESPHKIVEETTGKPFLLVSFLIITMVSRIAGIFAYILLIPFGPMVIDLLVRLNGEEMVKGSEHYFTHIPFLIICIVSGILQFTGAIYMWNLKKTGFHLYMIGKLAELTASYFCFGVLGVGLLDTLIWAIWPVVYFRHLRLMK